MANQMYASCPWCGGTDLQLAEYSVEWSLSSAQVVCMTCHAAGPETVRPNREGAVRAARTSWDGLSSIVRARLGDMDVDVGA